MHKQRKQNLMQKLNKMLYKINVNSLIPMKELPSKYKMGKRGISYKQNPTKFEIGVIEAFS